MIQRCNRPVVVIIGYRKYLDLRQRVGGREARPEACDAIGVRDTDTVPEQVVADVSAVVRAI